MTLLCNYDAAATRLAPDLPDAIDFISRGAFVHVTPCDKRLRPFYGYVEVTFPERERALVRHISGRVMGDFGIDELKLIYAAGVEEAEVLAAATTSTL